MQMSAAIKFLVLLIPCCAQAASFDCTRAKTTTEKTICQVRSLNDADVKLSTLYHFSLNALPMGGRDQQRSLQVAWLKQRNQCVARIQCLQVQYSKRQAEIDQLLQQRVLSQGPF